MKRIYPFIILTIFFVGHLEAQLPYNNRYHNPIFDSITIDTNIVYGTAPALVFPYLSESNTVDEDLLLDIYQPADDTLNLRPLILCAHSGAFLSGSRKNDDMVDFCDSLAHRGYVAASIDYRLGMNIFNTASSVRAVYRGLQDGRADIRFFKEFAGQYKIDTNHIYLLGSSAGSFIGLHNMFMDTEEERPPETYDTPDLGCLDCSGNNYQHSGKANAVVSLWGAIKDTSLIVNTDSLPLFLVHGKADDVVFFDVGSPFGYSTFPEVYGSWPISLQRDYFGYPAQTYFVEGVGHEFYGANNGMWGTLGPNAYWDTIFYKTDTFFYNVNKPKAAFYSVGMENAYTFFDLSTGSIEWHWDFGDGTFSDEQNPIHVYLSSGHYKATQMVLNNLTSWDTTSQYIDIFVSVNETHDKQIVIYPNPVANRFSISGDYNSVKIYNNSGKQVLTDGNLKTIDISKLPRGVYFVELKINDKKVIKRIVKM